jgi:NADH:ubiquinone oxidoreductase subunit E
MLRGGHEIYHKIKEDLGIGHNEVTEDGKISLEEVECMGACGGAPMIAVNEQFYENIDYDKVKQIIASLG